MAKKRKKEMHRPSSVSQGSLAKTWVRSSRPESSHPRRREAVKILLLYKSIRKNDYKKKIYKKIIIIKNYYYKKIIIKKYYYKKNFSRHIKNFFFLSKHTINGKLNDTRNKANRRKNRY